MCAFAALSTIHRYYNGTYRKLIDCVTMNLMCRGDYGPAPSLIVDGSDALYVGCVYTLARVWGWNNYTLLSDPVGSYYDGTRANYGGIANMGRAVHDGRGYIVFTDGTPYNPGMVLRRYNLTTGEFTTIAGPGNMACLRSMTAATCALFMSNRGPSVDYYYYHTEGVRGMTSNGRGDVYFIDNSGFVWCLLANGTIVSMPRALQPSNNPEGAASRIAADGWNNLCVPCSLPRVSPVPQPLRPLAFAWKPV